MLLKEPDDHGCKYVNVFASKLLSRKETEVSLSNSDASLATLSPVAFYCSNACSTVIWQLPYKNDHCTPGLP